MSSRPYPADIDPQSQCRLPLPRRDELDAEGQRVFDSLADPQGGSLRGLRGPGGIHLHSPELARHTRPLNRYLRQQAGLGGRLRELAILVTARELDSQFEWAAHEAEARREGLSPEIIETIRHRRDTGGLNEADAVVIELGREIFTARKVSSARPVHSSHRSTALSTWAAPSEVSTVPASSRNLARSSDSAKGSLKSPR